MCLGRYSEGNWGDAGNARIQINFTLYNTILLESARKKGLFSVLLHIQEFSLKGRAFEKILKSKKFVFVRENRAWKTVLIRYCMSSISSFRYSSFINWHFPQRDRNLILDSAKRHKGLHLQWKLPLITDSRHSWVLITHWYMKHYCI